MKYPLLNIVTTTYFPDNAQGRRRADFAQKCIRSWNKYLHYDGPITIHIADDGSPINTILRNEPNIVRSYGDRKGVGASLNRGLQTSFVVSPLVVYIMDDWMLEEKIHLSPWVRLLLEDKDIGIVRLGPPHPGLTGEVINYPHGWALKLDRHHFAYGLRPAIYHKRFFDAYGWFNEGESAVETERKFNINFCESEGPCIIHAIFSPWKHMRTLDLGELEP